MRKDRRPIACEKYLTSGARAVVDLAGVNRGKAEGGGRCGAQRLGIEREPVERGHQGRVRPENAFGDPRLQAVQQQDEHVHPGREPADGLRIAVRRPVGAAGREDGRDRQHGEAGAEHRQHDDRHSGAAPEPSAKG